MIDRKQLDSIRTWYSDLSLRKPLLIRGARQVGKSTLVRMFAAQNNLNLIEINLEKPYKFTQYASLKDPKKLLQMMSFELAIKVRPENSLLFFDEIQQVPEMIDLLRYFYEEAPEYAVIATGSLLEFVLAEPSFSMPVGRISFLQLGPLDFMDYLMALGEDPSYDYICNYNLNDEVPELVHHKLTELLKCYILTGGMPAVVADFSIHRDLERSEKIKSEIIDTYRLDFNKYSSKTNLRLLNRCFDAMPMMVAKKMIFSHLAPDSKSRDVSLCVDQLRLAKIIYLAYRCDANGIPLRAEINPTHFKPIFLDIGLYLTMLSLNPLDIEPEKDLNLINQGALMEQFIGQQLLCQKADYKEPELEYWARENKSSSAEIDFVISHHSDIIPIEVKSGKTGSLKSLQVFCYEKNSSLAVRFNSDYPSIFKESRKIMDHNAEYTLLSLPHYMIFRLGDLLSQVGKTVKMGSL
jgi:uncharacterized protein